MPETPAPETVPVPEPTPSGLHNGAPVELISFRNPGHSS